MSNGIIEDFLLTELRKVVREEVRAAFSERRAAEEQEQLVGVPEAALRLGLSKSTIYKLAEGCKVPSVKIGGCLRFKVPDLNAYREAHRRSPEAVLKIAASAGPR